MANSCSIVVADDDPQIVDILALRCRELGLHVATAHDVRTAREAIAVEKPKLVVLDIDMPDGNGWNVREMMVRDEALASIPVIILTGCSDRETVRRCHRTSAYFVPKCRDVWPRVEPLVRELLRIPSNEPTSEPTNAPQKLRPETMDEKACFVDHSPAGSGRHSTIDQMFSLLGWNGQYLVEPAEECSLAPSRPWVLCIDDDSEYSFSLMIRLEKKGVDVLRAFAGTEGVRYATTSQASAIILDYEMPDGNGAYVLRRLKECPATCDIPVIVLTGRNDNSIRRTLYNLGANRFLTKPCDWETLWSALENYIEVPATLSTR